MVGGRGTGGGTTYRATGGNARGGMAGNRGGLTRRKASGPTVGRAVMDGGRSPVGLTVGCRGTGGLNLDASRSYASADALNGVNSGRSG